MPARRSSAAVSCVHSSFVRLQRGPRNITVPSDTPSTARKAMTPSNEVQGSNLKTSEQKEDLRERKENEIPLSQLKV